MLWQSGAMEQAFFADEADEGTTKAGGKKRKKNPNASRPRKTAYMQLRALDKVLLYRTGQGLAQFLPEGALDALTPSPRTLVLHLDEAAPNVSMVGWMLFAKKLRIMFTRDPFHRCWNDVKLALMASGQFWAVLLCRVVFNLPYGPWEGCAWYEKLKAAAADLVDALPLDGPIWEEFYPLICRDFGELALGTPAHKAKIFKQALKEGARAKFERVVLNR